MQSTNNSSLEALLRCLKCFMPFDLKKRQPRDLHCGHTICSACLYSVLPFNRRCRIECPKCHCEQKYRKKDVASLEPFPINDIVQNLIAKNQARAPPEHCGFHRREASFFCFDPACRHKKLMCLSCVNDLHPQGHSDFIVALSEIDKRLSFPSMGRLIEKASMRISNLANALVENLQEVVQDQISAVVQGCYARIDEFDATTEVSQLQAHHSRYHFHLDGSSKQIRAEHKDQERIAKALDMIEQEITAHLQREVCAFTQSFIGTCQRLKQQLISQLAGEKEQQMLRFGLAAELPREPPRGFTQAVLDDIFQQAAQRPSPLFLKHEIDECKAKLSRGNYLVLAFVDTEPLSVETMRQIFKNTKFVEMNKRLHEALFREYSVSVTPTFLCHIKGSSEVKVVRMEKPANGLLESTLYDLDTGALNGAN